MFQDLNQLIRLLLQDSCTVSPLGDGKLMFSACKLLCFNEIRIFCKVLFRLFLVVFYFCLLVIFCRVSSYFKVRQLDSVDVELHAVQLVIVFFKVSGFSHGNAASLVFVKEVVVLALHRWPSIHAIARKPRLTVYRAHTGDLIVTSVDSDIVEQTHTQYQR